MNRSEKEIDQNIRKDAKALESILSDLEEMCNSFILKKKLDSTPEKKNVMPFQEDEEQYLIPKTLQKQDNQSTQANADEKIDYYDDHIYEDIDDYGDDRIYEKIDYYDDDHIYEDIDTYRLNSQKMSDIYNNAVSSEKIYASAQNMNEMTSKELTKSLNWGPIHYFDGYRNDVSHETITSITDFPVQISATKDAENILKNVKPIKDVVNKISEEENIETKLHDKIDLNQNFKNLLDSPAKHHPIVKNRLFISLALVLKVPLSLLGFSAELVKKLALKTKDGLHNAWYVVNKHSTEISLHFQGSSVQQNITTENIIIKSTQQTMQDAYQSLQKLVPRDKHVELEKEINQIAKRIKEVNKIGESTFYLAEIASVKEAVKNIVYLIDPQGSDLNKHQSVIKQVNKYANNAIKEVTHQKIRQELINLETEIKEQKNALKVQDKPKDFSGKISHISLNRLCESKDGQNKNFSKG